MKKRGPPLSAIKDEQALHAIWYALEADPGWLANRLRSGIASNAEQEVAADLIEGKIKPRRPRHGSERQRRLEIAELFSVLKKAYPKWRKKAVTGAVIKAFEDTIADRHVSEVRTEFDLAQIERIREARPKKVLSTRQETAVGIDGKPMQITLQQVATDYGAQDVDHDTLVEIVNKLLARNDRDTLVTIFTKGWARLEEILGRARLEKILEKNRARIEEILARK